MQILPNTLNVNRGTVETLARHQFSNVRKWSDSPSLMPKIYLLLLG